MTPQKVNRFKNWLKHNGAELLTPTNPYELVRFLARGGTHVVYAKANGSITVNGFASECLKAFGNGKQLDMGFVKVKRKNSYKKYIQQILDRDGNSCFYCGKIMKQEDMTVEHLIPISQGGPNRMSNMALAHKRCNQAVGSLSLVEKIVYRDRAHSVKSELVE